MAPDSNLFVFSNSDDDIVNFGMQKWETLVDDFHVGDSVSIAKTNMNDYDSGIIDDVVNNMIKFTGLRFLVFDSCFNDFCLILFHYFTQFENSVF